MYTGILHTHVLSVILFLVLYLVKTFLLTTGKDEALEKVARITKHPERLISPCPRPSVGGFLMPDTLAATLNRADEHRP